MCTRSFPGVKDGQGVLLNTHLLIVTWSWKGRAIPLPTLWATTGSVTGTLYFTLLNTHKHTHTHITFQQSRFLKAGRRPKHYEAAVCISPNSFPLNFFIFQSSLFIAIPIYFKFQTLLLYQAYDGINISNICNNEGVYLIL